jgi:EmrB/QacA subfamily drug resistance transporter
MSSSSSGIRSLWIIFLSASLVPFTGSAINLALPELARHFSMNAVTTSWVNTAYLITTAIFQVPFARLADLFGRKKIFFCGLLLFALSSCLCTLAWSSAGLLIFRSFQGLGSAMIFGTNVAILTSIVAPAKRGQALGIQTMVVYISLASGPFFGGLLTSAVGWQSIFYVPALLALVTAGLGFLFLKGEWTEAKGEGFDWLGTIIYAIALFGLIYGFTRLPGLEGIIWLLIGAAGFVGFVKQENRCRFPVFNMNIFKGNKVFVFSSTAALINYSATSATAFMISLYLQHIRGLSPHSAGLILISQAITQSCCTYFSGKYSDKTSPFKLATTGMLIIVIGLLGLVFLSATTPLWGLIVMLVLMGIGFGIFASPNMNIIMSAVDKRQYGQASATTGTVRQIGHAFSMSIATLAIYSQIGNAKITSDLHPQFMTSLHITFITFFLLCIVGTYASTVSGRQKTKVIFTPII